MKRLLILSLILTANVGCNTQKWEPDVVTIIKLEVNIKPGDISKGGRFGQPPVVAQYARYYAGYTVDGHRMISGELVIPVAPEMKPAGIYVVGSEKDFPIVFDGGCAVVHVVYAVETTRIVSLECNGDA